MQISFLRELRSLGFLALPIVLSGAVNAVMPFMNTVYLGHLNSQALAVGGLALSIFVFIMVLFWGMFSTLSPLIARLHGEGRVAEISPLVRSGLLLTLPMSLLIVVVYHYVDELLVLFNYAPPVVAEIREFFFTLSFSTPADLMLTTLYAFCLGIAKPRYVLAVTLIQIPVNLFLNHVFMYGDFGMPAFGVSGIGVGMTCTYWVMLIALTILLSSLKNPRQYLYSRHKVRLGHAWELLKVGGPSGMQWLLTMGFFAIVSLVMGKLSLVALAAYQIVFQFYSVIYNLVYNFNQAVTIRVAEGIGAGLLKRVLYNYLGAYIFIGFILVAVLLFIGFNHEALIHLFTKAGEVQQAGFFDYARHFLYLLPVFMIVDLLSYTHFEALRAFKDTRFPMVVVFCVYWVMSMPIILIGIHKHWITHPVMLWWLMTIASLLCLLGQAWRYRYQYRLLKSKIQTLT